MKRIFVLACGPRSGSTWLQRLLTSTGDVLIWGETAAFGSTNNLYDRLMRAPAWYLPPYLDPTEIDNYQQFADSREWTPDTPQDLDYDLHAFDRSGPNIWMAVLQPTRQHGETAARHYLDQLYGNPALDRGYAGWGTKEVCWTRHTVEFLLGWHDAQLVFLRRPLARILQSRGAGTEPYYGRARDEWMVECLVANTTSLADEFADHDRCHNLEYEQLDFETIQATCQQLGLGGPDRKVFETRIG